MTDRFYGTDETDQFDTLAELTVEDDGSMSLVAVVIDKGGLTQA